MINIGRRGLCFIALSFAAICLAAAAVVGLKDKTNTASAQTGETATVAIIMYHALMQDEARSGAYVITPEQLEDDFKYLKDNGYCCISFGELYEFTRNEEMRLPEKAVIITFDDGYYNNYAYGFELMKRYGIKCLISPIMIRTQAEEEGKKQSIAYSHLNRDQIREMYLSGLVEFGNHTYDMHSLNGRYGIKQKPSEDDESYTAAIKADIEKAQRIFTEDIGITPTVFAYPFGYYGKTSEALLTELGFTVSLSCEEGLNTVTKNSSLRLLKRYNRPSGISSEEFFSTIFSYEQ